MLNLETQFDIIAIVKGGGLTDHFESIQLGSARLLVCLGLAPEAIGAAMGLATSQADVDIVFFPSPLAQRQPRVGVLCDALGAEGDEIQKGTAWTFTCVGGWAGPATSPPFNPRIQPPNHAPFPPSPPTSKHPPTMPQTPRQACPLIVHSGWRLVPSTQDCSVGPPWSSTPRPLHPLVFPPTHMQFRKVSVGLERVGSRSDRAEPRKHILGKRWFSNNGLADTS